MENKKVSAIITTKNRKDLLLKSINSIRNQTYKNIEIIVVDDNSTDGTKDFCLSQTDIKYIYIPKEESHGGNYARNLGIKNSTGYYLAFLDDDDEWQPTKIEKQVALIDEKKNDYVYCALEQVIITPKGIRHKIKSCNPIFSGDVSRKILTKIFTTTSCILVTRKLLDNIGLFDEDVKFWQEYELSLRAAQYTEFYFVDEPLTLYLVNRADKQRLTNKLFRWCGAVKYIHKKHIALYKALTIKQSLMYKKLVCKEFVARFCNMIFQIF